MADASESFNVEAVKSQMSTLEGYFNDLSEKLSEINKTVNEEINVGPESAVFGQLGSKLLGTWNANASTFGDFHANFESWSQIVAIIAANNTSFDAETINLYKDNGSTLTYAGDDGTRLTISSLRESKANEQTFNYLSSKYSDSKNYETSIEDNVLKVKDKDGNVVVEYTVDNGKLKNTKTYDEDGNYSLVMYGVDEDGNKTVEVKYYDKDGKELKEKPSAFNEDGTLKTKTIFDKISEDIANKGKEIRDSFVDGSNELMDTGKEKFDDLSKKIKDYENMELKDCKNGDTVLIDGKIAKVNVTNEGKTISYDQDGKVVTLNVSEDGKIKVLPGENVKTIKINGKDVETTRYTSEELAKYYAEKNSTAKNYSYKDYEGNDVNVTVKDGYTITESSLKGTSLKKYEYDDGKSVLLTTKADGSTTIVKKDEEGNGVPISEKDAIVYANKYSLENNGITYSDKDGSKHTIQLNSDGKVSEEFIRNSDGSESSRTRTYADNGDYAVLEDGKVIGCYDSSDKEKAIADTVFSDNGKAMSTSEILKNTKKSGESEYKIEAEGEYSSNYQTIRYVGNTENNKAVIDSLYASASKSRDAFNSDSQKIADYLEKNKDEVSSNQDLEEFLNSQLEERKNISQKFEEEFYVGDHKYQKDGAYGDISNDSRNNGYNTGSKYTIYGQDNAYDAATKASSAHNEEFKSISTVDDINEVLRKLGYPTI